MAKARADSVVAAIKAGATLEAAGNSVRLAPMPIMLTRQQPDPRLSGGPEMIGMLLGAPTGKVVGPVRTSQGWMFARKDAVFSPADSLLNDQLKGQLTTEILSQRQRRFFDGYVEKLRSKAQITDLRNASGGM
jgi:hypothetical protein